MYMKARKETEDRVYPKNVKVTKELLKECYENLGNAVVLQAANDYRDSCKKIRKLNKKNVAENSKEEKEIKTKIRIEEGNIYKIKRFMQSEYFSLFTNIDGSYLIDKLEEEQEAV